MINGRGDQNSELVVISKDPFLERPIDVGFGIVGVSLSRFQTYPNLP
jgi:hypothetical protein